MEHLLSSWVAANSSSSRRGTMMKTHHRSCSPRFHPCARNRFSASVHSRYAAPGCLPTVLTHMISEQYDKSILCQFQRLEFFQNHADILVLVSYCSIVCSPIEAAPSRIAGAIELDRHLGYVGWKVPCGVRHPYWRPKGFGQGHVLPSRQ